MKHFTILAIAFFLLTGCAVTIVVDPIPCDKFRDCKNNIEKVYMSQKPEKAPISINITDEAIFLINHESSPNFITGGTTVQSKSSAIYFNKIKKLRVVDDNTKRFEIRFYYPVTRTDYIIFLYDKDLAIEGYSALKCMIDKAKENLNTKDMY